uniref:Acyl-coenzyme A thioesterase 13 n=1 Tax=Anthurium amnicola TaxID=1678845 RepID=A0A1D1YL77_9ARAE
MDLQAVKVSLEKAGEDILPTATLQSLPSKIYDALIIQGIRLDHVEPGRVICSMRVPPRLLSTGNFLHGGAASSLVDILGSVALWSIGRPNSGVSLEINLSHVDAAHADEEIEIEAKVLRVGKAIGVVAVELRKKQSGKIIAHGRHTKYLAASSKL